MQEQHVTDLIPAYALGALEPAEVDVVERHLATCAQCSAEARLYARFGDELLLAAPPVSAPPRLRERLLAQARATLAQTPQTGAEATTPAAPSPTPTTSYPAPRSGGRISRAWRAALGRGDEEADQTLRDLMLDPQSIVVMALGTADAPAASARLIASPQRGVAVLVASGLGVPGAGRAYQVWLLRDGRPIPNAMFDVDTRGRGLALVRMDQPLRVYDTVAVTPEPAGGSPSPTGPIVLAGALKAS